MADGVLYCLNLNSVMRSRVRSRRPLIFPAKLYLFNISQQQFSGINLFCHEELHLRCYIELELNIVTWSTKILKGIGVPPTSWSSATLGKYEKLIHFNILKIHFQRFYALTLICINSQGPISCSNVAKLFHAYEG